MGDVEQRQPPQPNGPRQSELRRARLSRIIEHLATEYGSACASAHRRKLQGDQDEIEADTKLVEDKRDARAPADELVLRIEELMGGPGHSRARLRFVNYIARSVRRRVISDLYEFFDEPNGLRPNDPRALYLAGMYKQYELEAKPQDEIIKEKERRLAAGDKSRKMREHKRSPPPQSLLIEEIDDEAADCGLSLAQRFCRGILKPQLQPGCRPASEYRDITAMVMQQLSERLGYEAKCDDRKSQQMRALADAMARWVVGLLEQLAEARRRELEMECLRRRKAQEEKEAKMALAQQQALQDLAEDSGQGSSDDEEEEGDDTDDADLLKQLCAGVPREGDEECVRPTMICDDDDDADGQGDGAGDDGAVCDIPEGDDQCQMDEAGACLKRSEEVQAATCAAPVDCQTDEGNCLCEQLERNKPSDLPFVTFAKIIEALFCALEREPPVMPGQPEVDRLHRAIYEKFEDILDGEKKDILKQDSKLRDLLNVATGKIAVWLSRKLDSQIKRALAEHPAEVESKEIRHWSQDIVRQADVAENWCNWIEQVAREAAELKRPQRGEYCRWTGGVQKTCMRYRKAYLETLHEQHHNDMMLRGREVVKTGEKRPPPPELGETFVGCSEPDPNADAGCSSAC
ncbi:hypothetical protein TKK_0003154 [Trichogramma kaykai]|uniref:Uncharacterized protein n=1 Tax=Trichogramma kaykai TaxID=54128 RepID=A0ABD2WSC7_9HYME